MQVSLLINHLIKPHASKFQVLLQSSGQLAAEQHRGACSVGKDQRWQGGKGEA